MMLPKNKCSSPAGIVESCVDYVVKNNPKRTVEAERRRMDTVYEPQREARAKLASATIAELGGSRTKMPKLAAQAAAFCDLYERTTEKPERQMGYINAIRAATTPALLHQAVNRLKLDSVDFYQARRRVEAHIKAKYELVDEKPEECC